jgi:hypothetical protein
MRLAAVTLLAIDGNALAPTPLLPGAARDPSRPPRLHALRRLQLAGAFLTINLGSANPTRSTWRATSGAIPVQARLTGAHLEWTNLRSGPPASVGAPGRLHARRPQWSNCFKYGIEVVGTQE